ncbi:hypothetical protein COU80_02670 [Candidatus Peregrinibacteria bacterium CG10_big_fil_rev_8_21_14_0_10_55_24]|nr:MAG: hypothetical protein COU80_02670 [Candidatus Peregrinibacteria bacterium CG10_big_fil_rev_8_21_14_0_10_55_24]
MQQICANAWCKQSFESTDEDLAFYRKISPTFAGETFAIPPPTQCFSCRQARRLAYRNERHLYHRSCDLTRKDILSIYSPDKPTKVYEHSAWWSDKWDPLSYGRDFDFSRPFFEQFFELQTAVPRINVNNMDCENSDFCNFSVQNRNCYLLFGALENQDSFYSNRILYCKDCCDCSGIEKCELCYECNDSQRCYQCRDLQNCSHCTDCQLGYNLHSCKNCFGCVNLQNASFCIENVAYSEQEYKELLEKKLSSYEQERKNFQQRKLSAPRKYMDAINTEHCTGNAIINSKNALDCYEVMDLEDCRYLANATFMRDAYDTTHDDHSELVYEAIGSETNFMHLFCDICWYDRELLYCSMCFNSQNLFGCCGMRKSKYCILNKQYSKEEYEKLVAKIIKYMQETGEWGEFFPVCFSPFAYNETLAQEHSPLSKDAVEERGWNWKDEEDDMPDVEKVIEGSRLPADIAAIPDDILNWAIRCEVTQRPFRIMKQELAFYRKFHIPVPHLHPDERHRRRMVLRNPRKLWDRQCGKCSKEIRTSYAPERPEIVYCEDCYLKEVY